MRIERGLEQVFFRTWLTPVLLQNGLNRFEGNPAALRAGSGHRNWNDVFHDEAAARAPPFATEQAILQGHDLVRRADPFDDVFFLHGQNVAVPAPIVTTPRGLPASVKR
jgi:hypothetical protein